jgi:hypothetical protein
MAFSVSMWFSSSSSFNSRSASRSSIVIRISSIFWASVSKVQKLATRTYLAEHKVALRQLYEHVFCTHGVVELHLQILDLDLSIRQLDLRGLIVGCRISGRGIVTS